MTTAALTAVDVRLRDAVIRELDCDPEVDDSAMGVAAKDGVDSVNVTRAVIDALHEEGDRGKLRQLGSSSPCSDSLTI